MAPLDRRTAPVPQRPHAPRSEGGDLELALRETAERLSAAIELHDLEASRHVGAMARIAALIGTRIGLDPRRVVLLRAAAPLHDVGMIATPDGVRYKRGPLTRCERERMKAHTTVGHQILAGSESALLELAAEIALTHHEWFDGSGYPQGLGGGEVSIEGRIAALADVFDALLSERPHRRAFTPERARELVVAERGTHFDPVVVDALLADVDEALALRG